MSRILITGATGFIGSHLVPRLADRHEVHALARNVPAGGAAGVHWIEQDLSRPLEAQRLPGRVDALIHLAQSYRFREFPEGAADTFAVNVQSTFRLLEYARQAGAEQFIHASSGGVYGYSYESLAETAPVDPLNFYISSKYSAELLTASYRQFFRTVVFRFFFVYGPGQKGMLVPNLMQRVVGGQTITVQGKPGIRINPVYVDDAVGVFEPALRLQTSELFNVAGDQVVTITELVRLMGELAGKTPVVEYTETRYRGDLVGDNARMKTVLGAAPKVPLADGLARVLESLPQ